MMRAVVSFAVLSGLFAAAAGQEPDTQVMPGVAGLDTYSASRALRKLGVAVRYEQVRQDTAQAAQFLVAEQTPDSGAKLAPAQEVRLRFNCSAMLRYWGDFVVPLLGDFKRQVSFYKATRPPEPISMPGAGYPEELLKFTFSGSAGVEALVDFDGSVLAARVVESSGYELADSAALAAAMDASFTSALHHEQPVRVWFPIPYSWRYQDLEGLPRMKEGTLEGE